MKSIAFDTFGAYNGNWQSSSLLFVAVGQLNQPLLISAHTADEDGRWHVACRRIIDKNSQWLAGVVNGDHA